MTKYRVLANAIRGLSMDAVEKANSGHPGAPMGMADMASVLWTDYLNVNPNDPNWDNRDRFVLSNGHASMLLYSLLHLTGYDLSLEDLKSFRQMNSKTPGHPEYRETAGVETTTGPLGQGVSNAVGFALAEAHLAATYNKSGFPIVDHYTYCFAGDGCLMEGISHEACSYAGTLGLGKLIVFYDSNHISIDGNVKGWFAEDVGKRFEAYGWQVIEAIDGHDAAAIAEAIEASKAEKSKPSLIICKTKIGFGSPKLEGSEKSHGAPFGADEILETKIKLGIPLAPFSIDPAAYEIANLREKGKKLETKWQELFAGYQKAYPELAAQYQRVISGKLPEDFVSVSEAAIKESQAKAAKVATRKASETALNILTPHLPELVGGSADLSGSNNTFSKSSKSISAHDFSGNYLHYGVREFAMAGIMNGMMLHGGIRPYGGTFLVFSDYMRNAIRLSALMKIPTVYVLTHDSIGLGEDGPTHQPVEHVASLRLIPNLNVWRPCDGVETLAAWELALISDLPSALVLTRQGLPVPERNDQQLSDIKRGAYVLKDADNAKITMIATGSEVELALASAKVLNEQGIATRVVSGPCMDVFKTQDSAYQQAVLPKGQAKIAIEAGVTNYWYEFVGSDGAVIGLDHFGASAPAAELFAAYGFTVDNVVEKAKQLIA